MNRLQLIIAYFCIHYPHQGELSNARLTKLVYLADWFSALVDEVQLTPINWVFNHYGPYVNDVYNAATESANFNITNGMNTYGGNKVVIGYNGEAVDDRLSVRDKQILDAVIEKTERLYFNDFINYVYSTYPIAANDRYSTLDLIELAREYKNQ